MLYQFYSLSYYIAGETDLQPFQSSRTIFWCNFGDRNFDGRIRRDRDEKKYICGKDRAISVMEQAVRSSS